MDSVLFTCDYSQNEVRILAHMSNDRSLLEAFQHEHKASDIYKQMSSFITGKAVEEVSSQERASTKQVVLAILYGMGVNQVASKLHLDKISAQRTITEFYQRFCGVQQWMEQLKESARKNGYVTTVAGRRRYVDINSSDNDTRAQAERQAINTVIQGSAADLIKLAMLKVASRLMEWKKEGGTHDPPKLILQIHDELVFEVAAKEDEIKLLKDIVIRCCTVECQNELQLKVPLKMDFKIGKSWGSAMREF